MDADELANRVARAMLVAEGTGPAWEITIEEARAGYARLSMSIRADMLNGHRIVHGGMVFALADTAFAYVCNGKNEKTVAGSRPMDRPFSLGQRQSRARVCDGPEAEEARVR
jgi:acyl-CoA thioesterase